MDCKVNVPTTSTTNICGRRIGHPLAINTANTALKPQPFSVKVQAINQLIRWSKLII